MSGYVYVVGRPRCDDRVCRYRGEFSLGTINVHGGWVW